MMVKAEATSSSHGGTLRDRTIMRSLPQSSGAEQTPDGLSSLLADLNSKVFPRDQTLLSSDDPPEVIQTIQGGLPWLHHLGDRLLGESPSLAREEVEKLTWQLFEEVSKRVAKEMELRDLLAKTKAIEELSEPMSQRSASSVPLAVGPVKRVDSPASQSGSSSDPGVELDGDLLAPLPLTYTYIAPPLVGPARRLVEGDLVEWQ
ncbi:hypothetical protein Bca52824_017857 [Brassica carinata]|uniref:Uncharacterized protein n=1 Tax=Brassica carinata TaxID=52824 RepID=A0A8X7VNZ7_BRACI|nr:hypothetical protein Bca52824_017857 [Brassica carinata]